MLLISTMYSTQLLGTTMQPFQQVTSVAYLMNAFLLVTAKSKKDKAT